MRVSSLPLKEVPMATVYLREVRRGRRRGERREGEEIHWI
jgi:hypothetical protein